MRKSFLVVAVICAAGFFSGCETVKCTLSGPFIGLSRDIENITPKVKQVHPVIAAEKLDSWMQRNMW